MSRMIDAIREHGIGFTHGPSYTRPPEIVFANVSLAEPIVADEIFRYYWEVSTERVAWQELPCVAPPYDAFWLEGRTPQRLRNTDGGFFTAPGLSDSWKCSGYYAQAVPTEYWREDAAKLRAEGGESVSVADDMERIVAGSIVRWVYSVTAFTQTRDESVLGPIASLWVAVDTEGRISDGRKFLIQDYRRKQGDALKYGDAQTLAVVFDPFWLAVSMFHVKNARLEPSEPVAEKLARSRERRGKPPLVTTSTIVVDPVRETLRRIDEARRKGEKIDLALHHVRAHYKTFTSDRPLFGRVTGRFFWPVHIRGSREHGERMHVYDVKAPGVA
jgi:hypothetical protein